MDNDKIDLNQLMQIDISNLAETQYKALHQHVLDKLKQAYQLVKNEDYQGIRQLLEYSPAGDGYGLDNRYINFGYNPEEPKDIDMVLDELSILKKVKDGEV